MPNRAGYDFIIQGMGGMMSITGLPDGEPGGGPMRAGVAIADLFTGMYTASRSSPRSIGREKSGRGRAHRPRAVRHPAGGARQPGGQCAGVGQGPAAAGQHPPQYRALPAVRRGRSADHHRGRQRSPVRAAGGDLRPSRMGRATSASRPTRRASPTARRWSPLVAETISGRSRRRSGSSSSKQRASRPGRSTASARRWPTSRRSTGRWCGRYAGVPLVGSPVRLDGERADSELPPPALGRAYARRCWRRSGSSRPRSSGSSPKGSSASCRC